MESKVGFLFVAHVFSLVPFLEPQLVSTWTDESVDLKFLKTNDGDYIPWNLT